MTRTQEFHDIIRVEDKTANFTQQLNHISDSITSLSRERHIQFVRFFLSEASNQQAALEETLSCLGNFPASIVQQPPLDGSKIVAWVYSTDRIPNPAYRHVWNCRMLSDKAGSLAQMEDIFQNYDSDLHNQNMSVARSCIRTWIFVRDIDTNYSGIVKGRNNFFEKIGLTKDSHFISSTGIQGSSHNHERLVLMDAYAVDGLEQRQIEYLHAETHLNPTHEYGVAFERGTSVTYGDRRHIFISGTASIDNKGEIVHPGDVTAQSARMMENICELLKDADATINDIKVSVVYLRDTADYIPVHSLFKQKFPNLDPIFVLAPVCRPGWLIEMECIAVMEMQTTGFQNF